MFVATKCSPPRLGALHHSSYSELPGKHQKKGVSRSPEYPRVAPGNRNPLGQIAVGSPSYPSKVGAGLPHGKDLISPTMSFSDISKSSGRFATGGVGMCESGWGGGCLDCRASKVSSPTYHRN